MVATRVKECENIIRNRKIQKDIHTEAGFHSIVAKKIEMV